MSSDASTPLMRQYNAVKEQVSGALLLFRLVARLQKRSRPARPQTPEPARA